MAWHPTTDGSSAAIRRPSRGSSGSHFVRRPVSPWRRRGGRIWRMRRASAARARIGLVWAAVPEDRRAASSASAGLSEDQAARVGAAVAALGVPRDEREVAPGAGGALAAELAALGPPARPRAPGAPLGRGPGRGSAARRRGASGGGPAAPSRGPGGRRADRDVCSTRSRLRANLERAMAQILETDERMLGRIGPRHPRRAHPAALGGLLEVQLLEAELADAEAPGTTLPESLRPSLGRIYETVGGALHEMRELIGHLRPAQFEDRRLPDILGDAVAAFEARSGLPGDAGLEGEFPEDGVSITQRITLLPHPPGDADQRPPPRPGHRGRACSLHRGRRPASRLEVTDNGVGLRPGAPSSAAARACPRRASASTACATGPSSWAASFDIRSAPGEGTAVRGVPATLAAPAASPTCPSDVA